MSQSVADTAVYPLQDVLGLGGAHRMNVPGRGKSCWEWRFEWDQVGDGLPPSWPRSPAPTDAAR